MEYFPTLKKKSVILNVVKNLFADMHRRQKSLRIDASYLSMTSYKTEVIPNLFRDPTGQVTRMMYT